MHAHIPSMHNKQTFCVSNYSFMLLNNLVKVVLKIATTNVTRLYGIQELVYVLHTRNYWWDARYDTTLVILNYNTMTTY